MVNRCCLYHLQKVGSAVSGTFHSPIKTILRLITSITCASSRLCGHDINGISFCYSEANKQNGVIFFKASHSEATQLTIIKLGNYFSEKEPWMTYKFYIAGIADLFSLQEAAFFWWPLGLMMRFLGILACRCLMLLLI